MTNKHRQKHKEKGVRVPASKKETRPPAAAPLSAPRRSERRSHVQSRGNAELQKLGESVPSQIFGGFHHKSSRFATLDEVRNPAIPTKSVGDLSHAELVRLVLARLRRDRGFVPLHMPGAKGAIDKRRAMREVKALSPIGLHLIEIEKEYIQLQLKRR